MMRRVPNQLLSTPLHNSIISHRLTLPSTSYQFLTPSCITPFNTLLGIRASHAVAKAPHHDDHNHKAEHKEHGAHGPAGAHHDDHHSNDHHNDHHAQPNDGYDDRGVVREPTPWEYIMFAEYPNHSSFVVCFIINVFLDDVCFIINVFLCIINVFL